jgi:hypothetical protein
VAARPHRTRFANRCIVVICSLGQCASGRVCSLRACENTRETLPLRRRTQDSRVADRAPSLRSHGQMQRRSRHDALRDGAMAKRWTGIGLATAESHFHRIKGHGHMPALVEALSRRIAKGIDQEETVG